MAKKKDNWKKIFGIIFILFFSIFSVFGIMIVFLKTDMPLTVVSSESMVPTYNPGDLLIIEYADEGEIMPSDVIVFWPITWEPWRSQFPMVPVVHRVISLSRDNDTCYPGTWYVTKGDFLQIADLLPFSDPVLTTDPAIPHLCVIGKVVNRIPYLGLPKLWMDSIGGNVMIYLILILLVVLLIYTFLSKEDKTDEDEKQDKTEKENIKEKVA